MAWIFKCLNCGECITVKPKDVDKVLKCPFCNSENVLPKSTDEAVDEAKHLEPNKYVRSVWEVFILTFVTFGIYWWFYMFGTLRDMEKALSFDSEKINPRKVRYALIGYILILIVIFIIKVYMEIKNHIMSQGTSSYISLSYNWEISLLIIRRALYATFLYLFIKLLGVCQLSVGIKSSNNKLIWILIFIYFTSNIADFIIDRLAKEIAESGVWTISTEMTLVSLVLKILYIISALLIYYLIVKRTNTIWTSQTILEMESKG